MSAVTVFSGCWCCWWVRGEKGWVEKKSRRAECSLEEAWGGAKQQYDDELIEQRGLCVSVLCVHFDFKQWFSKLLAKAEGDEDAIY